MGVPKWSVSKGARGHQAPLAAPCVRVFRCCAFASTYSPRPVTARYTPGVIAMPACSEGRNAMAMVSELMSVNECAPLDLRFLSGL